MVVLGACIVKPERWKDPNRVEVGHMPGGRGSMMPSDRVGQVWAWEVVLYDTNGQIANVGTCEPFLVLRVTSTGEWLEPPTATPQELREIDDHAFFRYDVLQLTDGVFRPGFLCESRTDAWEKNPLMRRIA